MTDPDNINLDAVVEDIERREQIVQDLNYYFDNKPINPWEDDCYDED